MAAMLLTKSGASIVTFSCSAAVVLVGETSPDTYEGFVLDRNGLDLSTSLLIPTKAARE